MAYSTRSECTEGGGSCKTGETNEGRAYVYHGGSTGLTTGSADWTAESDQADAHLGVSVSAAGDVNGDGYGDVIVGAYRYDGDQENEGRALIYHGSSTGLTTGSADWMAEGDQANGYFGYAVGAAGDVNADGYGDVIVGAYGYDNPETSEGRAFVYYGSGLPRVITYIYDRLNRLTNADYSTGESFAYQYDAVGNRTVMTSTTPLSGTLVTTYTYGAADRLADREVSDGRSYTYTWSARGQMLAEYTQGIPVRTFTYDGAGRMVEATVFTLTTVFTYNGLGARVAVEVVGQSVTTYVVDYAGGNRILAEQTLTGTTLYLYGRECLGQNADDEWLYYLTDGTGYVRQTTDEQGQLAGTWLFDPDGAVLEGPEGPVSHLMCGGVYDWSTGLIYKDGRYFDPLLGIWLALAPLIAVEWWSRRKKKRRGFPWISVLLMGVCVGGILTACGPQPPSSGTATPPLVVCIEPPSPTPPLPSPTPTPPPTPTPEPPTPTPGCCEKGFEPEPNPGAFSSTEAYLDAQVQYAHERTNAYTQDEQLVARMIWWEQKGQGSSAMRAAAWSVVHRKDDGVYFSHVDTIREVLEDRQCSSADTSGRCVQYQGYWRGDPLPEVERKWGPRPESGDPGDPGRARWFEALDIACRVLTNCAEDKTKGYLWWGNGESAELRMRAKEAEDPEGFDYFLIPASGDLYFCNQPY